MKNAIREADWTYRFLTRENIARIEFFLQGLLPKFLAIYTMKKSSQHHFPLTDNFKPVFSGLSLSITEERSLQH